MASEFVTAVAQTVRVADLPVAGSGRSAARSQVSVRPNEQAAQQQPPRPEQISQALEALNDLAQNQKRALHFSVDEGSGRTVIRVIDPETAEVIRQIPPEEVLNLARQLEGSGGALLRTRA